MSETTKPATTRREFLGDTGRIAAATTLAGLAVPHVHAGEDNTLRVALIGAGVSGMLSLGLILRAMVNPAPLA